LIRIVLLLCTKPIPQDPQIIHLLLDLETVHNFLV
jgi:hypothetical protein